MKWATFTFFIFSIVFGSCNSNSNCYSLKNTNWLLIETALDSINTYGEDSRAGISSFDTSIHLFSCYETSILITYLNNHADTTPYKQQKNMIFYNDKNEEKDAHRILKLNRETLVIKTPHGALYKMIRVDKASIPPFK